MREERVIGVDLGGTKILAGLVTRDGTIGRTIEIATPDGDQAEVLAAIDSVVRDLLADGAAAIGYGVPLNIDRRTGVALRAVNLPLNRVHFPDRARELCAPPAGVENDGNAAALAEWRLGSGRGATDLIMLTLGTGVGGGLVIDDTSLPRLGRARPRRRRGRRPAVPGQLSWPWASGGACVRARGRSGSRDALRAGRRCSGSRRAARAGDPGAMAALAEIGRLLGAAIGSLVNIFDPDIVIVGGGFGAAAGDLVLEPARIAARADAIQPADETLRIVDAELGDEAGLIGGRSSHSRRSTESGRRAARRLRDPDRQPRRRHAARARGARRSRDSALRGACAPHPDPARAARGLVGLQSFAEGLDLKGELLSQVHIHKIAFPPVDSPVILTEGEWLKSLKRYPFEVQSLPSASFNLIQQVGRLIRSHDCFGEIIIYDRRLINKSYGARLLGALPIFPIEQPPMPEGELPRAVAPAVKKKTPHRRRR